MKKSVIKILIAVGIIVAVYFVLRHYGITKHIRLENVPKIKTWVESFGVIAPLIYIGLYLISTVFFLPGFPVTVLAGFVFGPLWGVFLCIHRLHHLCRFCFSRSALRCAGPR